MVFDWLFKKKKENGDDEIFTLLNVFLDDYPDGSHKRKIVTSLSKNKVSALSGEDFENIDKNSYFLHNCGSTFTICGTKYSRVDYLNFAINLFERTRNFSEKETQIYAMALYMESITRITLARLGANIETNLKKTIELTKNSREVFNEKTKEYGNALLVEGNAKTLLAKRGENSLNNLEEALDLYAKARIIFDENSQDYGKVLGYESIARKSLAELGIDSTENYAKAIELYTKSRNLLE